MLMLPSFHPWPLVSSDCLLYKGGAGRVSVKGRQPDRLCLLSLACRPHPATMLGGSQFTGQFCWPWLTNETKALKTQRHTQDFYTLTWAHPTNGKKVSLPTALMHYSVFWTPGVAGPVLMCVSQPDGFLVCSQSIKTALLQHQPPESLSVFCWPWGLTLTECKAHKLQPAMSASSWDKSAQRSASIDPSLKRWASHFSPLLSNVTI